MNITINGKNETVEAATDLAALIASKKLCAERIVVEHNLRIVPREEWNRVPLREQDTVEIVSFVGGG